MAGNECADQVAKYQASLRDDDLTDTNIPSAGPDGIPFYNIAWLAWEEARPSTPVCSSPIPNLILPRPEGCLESYMHAKHRLGYADRKTGHYTSYQSLLPHASEDIGNAFWNILCISTCMKRTIFQYRIGSLYNQKHAVCFKRSTSLVCPLSGCYHMDSALHILSGFQSPVIHNMVTERHNIASRMILEVSKGSYVSNLVHMDVGSADRLAQHNLHITEHVSSRVIPPYLFDPSIPDQVRRTSSCPDAILVTPCPAKPNRPPTPPSHWVFRSIRGNEEEGSNTTPARQSHELNIQNCHVHSLGIKL
eukprot:1137276-Pelagomonas_calceolata.AAC.1